jgi:hypothetical protein
MLNTRASFRFTVPGSQYQMQDHGRDIPEPTLLAGLKALLQVVREDEATWGNSSYPKGGAPLRDLRARWIEIRGDRASVAYFTTGRFFTWEEVRALLAAGGTGNKQVDAHFLSGLVEHDNDSPGLGGRFTGMWQTGFGGDTSVGEATDQLAPNLTALINASFAADDAKLLRKVTGVDKVEKAFLG